MRVCDDVKLLKMAVAGLHRFSCYDNFSGLHNFCDDIGSSRSELNGSSSDGLRYASEDTRGSETEHEDDLSCLSEQSNDLERIRKDKVKQVFQERLKNGCVSNSNSSVVFHQTGSQWLSGNVKIIKEWVQISAQRSIRDPEACLQIDPVRNEMSAQRSIRRICGRQTLSDLLKRDQQRRKVELMALLDQRPVSDFAYRNRIQAFLRGRFLRNENMIPEKKSSSVAALELGVLRQRRTVSGLREEFLSKSDSPLSGDENFSDFESTCKEMASTGNHDTDESQKDSIRKLTNENHQFSSSILQLNDVEEKRETTVLNEMLRENEDMRCDEHREYTSVAVHSMNEQCDSFGASAYGTSDELNNQWLYETCDTDTLMVKLGEGWLSQYFQESNESWTSSSPSTEIGESSRTSCSHIDRYTELQELFSRKQVSNLLRSSFGKRLDQILQSHVEKQRCVSVDPELDHASALFDEFVPSFLHQDSVVINELRIDMAQLQEKMNSLQNMLEDCLYMQIELQRSIQQEVSSAIHHSLTMRVDSVQDQESNWDSLRRNICCQCHKNSIDSLLYRCGHMCTCTRCAEELVRCNGNCPICMFPVPDTFRTT